MSGSRIPAEAPPSYTQATGSSNASTSTSAHNASSQAHNASSYLNVPGASTSVPEAYRRSMEDEARPLPKGWVRTFDPESEHQFYVDTTVDPPRSIWHHPYDDDEFLAKLPAAERERIEQESMSSYLGNAKHDPSMEDYIHSHSDIEDDDHQHAPTGSAAAAGSSSAATAELPPRPDGKDKNKGKDPNRSFGRKLKDKVTGTTHEDRQRQRAAREAEEQRMYEQHLRMRRAMAKAMETGEPQPIGKDKDGKELYISPPKQTAYSGGYGGGMGMGGYGNMYNPYASGMYASPGMYSRPIGPYSRPMYGGGYGGYGYGGRGYYGGSGMGFPLALGGGLLAGGLLGGALF